MSITFYASRNDEATRCQMPLEHCDCAARWMAVTDSRPMDDWPDPYQCDRCAPELNVSNANGADLLRWLNYDAAPCGTVSAAELAARCQRRLWDVARNHDPALSADERAAALGLPSSPRCITVARPADYLRDRTEQLLELAEHAGQHFVSWG